MSTQKEKIRVDEEDILNDAMAYYKDPSFDPTRRLRVLYTGQPAVDTGGVTRHLFSQLLQIISEMFFQGTNFKSPVYNADTVASGMMKFIGTIIVHSLLLGGPGFPVLSPAVYRYIATGDVDAAMMMLNYGDCSEPVKNLIDKVAQAVEVSTLDQEECASFLTECGLAVVLTNDNKMRVIQGIIIHDVISLPKIVLDQLREGLNVLGFGAKMAEYPELFEKLFVPNSESTLSATRVVDLLQFPANMSEADTTVANYLTQFVQKADIQVLKKFLFFVTGSTCMPYGLSKINVKFDHVPSIFASACLLSLTLPNQFESEENLDASLNAVIASTGKSFNCV